MNLIIPEWNAPKNVRAFSTVRYGGISKTPYQGGDSGKYGLNFGMHVGDSPLSVRKNRAILREELPAEPVWLNQVHGITVVNGENVTGVPDADASFAEKKGIVCTIMTADCLPVLLCDSAGTVVAAAHAGWRGLAGGVLENTIAVMRGKTDSEIMAWLGPAIGPGSFEVGEDVRDAFVQKNPVMASAFVSRKDNLGKYLADIYALAKMTLDELGVTDVSGGGFCTVTDKERFYSYRRDGVTGRMATGIWLAD
ncbi:peptidoglycan editing factor PgeF [Oxalobacter formigenes]|uniref:peptidoglycan editing factor PgeF n=1 Tax=Oxalobacter formigenes TaxID=847 RepID=UPI0024203907|nr:peptidoglycan editing factor PgeF [Oxalobacter formigenes]